MEIEEAEYYNYLLAEYPDVIHGYFCMLTATGTKLNGAKLVWKIT